MNRATMLAAVDDLLTVAKNDDMEYIFFVPKQKSLDEDEIMQSEYDLLGYYVTKHPLESCSTRINDLDKINNLEHMTPNQNVTIGGIITEVKSIVTKKGNPMAFLQVEDLTGRVEVVVFSKTYEQYKNFLNQNALIEISGKLELKEEEKETEEGIELVYIPKILMYKIKPLEKIGKINKLVITLTKNDDLELIEKTISKHPGEIPITLQYSSFEIDLHSGFDHSTKALSGLQETCLLKEIKDEA